MKIFIFINLFFNLAFSARFNLEDIKQKPINITAVSMFLIFVLATLLITYYSNKKSKSKSGFYTAGGNITGIQNGMAIAGDYMSAASFLGITALVFTNGFDGLIYSIGFLVGWPIILFLIAEKFRNLGKFTFADITAYRLEAKPIRIISAISALSVIIFLPYSSNGRSKTTYTIAFWFTLYFCSCFSRYFNDLLCNFWRNACNHLGANYKGYFTFIRSKFYDYYDLIPYKI